MAKLTIVVPIYNVAPYLSQCVDSILAQTFEDFTLLLMDDGSTDASPSLCDQYAAHDPRVIAVHHQNMGVEQTILKGIGMAQTPYIGFVDGDDWLLPDMYQTMLTAMETEGADCVQCGALINGTTRNPAFISAERVIIQGAKETYYRNFFEKNATLAPLTNARWSKVYHTATLQKSIASPLFAQGVTIGEDLLLNLAYLCQSNKILVLAESNFYCYRSNEQSLTQAYSDKKESSILRLYVLLAALAEAEGFTSAAIATEGKNAICSLMLYALLSPLSISEKTSHLRFLYQELSDKPYILKYAKDRPLIGKIALYFVYARLFWLISAVVTLAKKVLPL